VARREGSVSPWVWAGAGCCLGCVVLPVALALIVGALGFGAMGAMMHSDVVDDAVARAAADRRVVEALGEPLVKGWLVQGSMEVAGGTGSADLAIPVSGPNGSGKLYLVARKQAGEWAYERLALEVEATGERIELPLSVEAPTAL
jgi:hypothetical protein